MTEARRITIVCGSRNLTAPIDRVFIRIKLSGFLLSTDTVMQGGCPQGPDSLAKKWALETGMDHEEVPAKWAEHGKAAGPIRNREMARRATSLLAFWDGKSRGTASMIWEGLKASLSPIHVYIKKGGEWE